MSYTLIDCCPAPDGLAEELKILKAASGCAFASIYRGTDAADLLAQCGKHDQAWLYNNLPPGVANPPGHSTHELFNDGVAYPGPDGMKLEYWQVGLDIDDAHVEGFCAAARGRGWVATITYPGSAVEHHHVNFRFEPHAAPPFKPLRHGSRGPRVVRLTRRLHFIHHPGGHAYLHRRYWKFKDPVVAAVKDFQRDHKNLRVDGVVGIHTHEQIERTFRSQYRARHG